MATKKTKRPKKRRGDGDGWTRITFRLRDDEYQRFAREWPKTGDWDGNQNAFLRWAVRRALGWAK